MIAPLLRQARCQIQRRPLAAVLLLGLALRLVRIQGRGLQYDDAFSIFLSARSLPEIVYGTAADTMPPLYYFTLHFWMLISREVWFIRSLTVLLSMGIIVLTYAIVERWLGRAAAVWAALFTAAAPIQIYHAQDVRMYALLVLGQAGYLWFFTRIWFSDGRAADARAADVRAANGRTQQPWGDWAGLVLCGLAAMYSHNLAVFALIVPNLFLLARRRWSLLGRLAAAQLVIGLGALPWLALLPGQLEKIQTAFWTPRPGPVEIIQAVIMFTATLPLPPVVLLIAAVLSFQLLVLAGLQVWRCRHEPGVALLAALLLVPPALLFCVSYLMRPVFVPRGFLVSSLAYYGLVGYAVAQAWQCGPGKLIAGAFLLAAALSLPSLYAFDSFPRSPFEQAAGYLRANPGQARLVHETKLSYFPFHFYAPDLEQVFIADRPGSANDTLAPRSQQALNIYPQADLAEAVGDSAEVYFITFSEVFAEYQAAGERDHPGIRWLEEHYSRDGHTVFNDLEIFHYVR